MAIDISKLGEKELRKLKGDVEKALAKMEKQKVDEARKAAEAAAKKFGYSLGELVGAAKPGPKPKTKAKRAPSAAKYRNPEDPSQTWSGRGRQPGWYKEAVAKGTDPKDLAV